MAENREALIPHLSLNPDSKTTIVLIHGAFVNSDDWNLVYPHLTDYHLLIPDLPGHGQSRHLTPFTVEYAARLIGQLIEARAVGGSAYVVGLSLGAHVALRLAANRPALVGCLLITGYQTYHSTTPRPPWLAAAAPYALWLEQRIENAIPRAVLRYLMDGTDVQRTDPAVVTLPLCRQIIRALTVGPWPPPPWPARSLVVAATQGGVIPALDEPEVAARLACVAAHPDTFAVVARSMRHPWNRQRPGVFATTVRAWLMGDPLPSGFERL